MTEGVYRVHATRNALDLVPRGSQDMVAAAIRTVFEQPGEASASEQLRRVADGLAARFPAVSDLLLDAEADILVHFTFPEAHRRQILSTQDPELQLDALRAYIAARGWEAIEYGDMAAAGDLAHRTAWARLLTDVAQRKVDLVMVWKLDRAFRSTLHALATLQDFEHAGVGFASLTQPELDTTSATGASSSPSLRPSRRWSASSSPTG